MKLKKVFALVLASSMVLGMTACGGTEEKKTADAGKEATEESGKKDELTIWAWDEAFMTDFRILY